MRAVWHYKWRQRADKEMNDPAPPHRHRGNNYYSASRRGGAGLPGTSGAAHSGPASLRGFRSEISPARVFQYPSHLPALASRQLSLARTPTPLPLFPSRAHTWLSLRSPPLSKEQLRGMTGRPPPRISWPTPPHARAQIAVVIYHQISLSRCCLAQPRSAANDVPNANFDLKLESFETSGKLRFCHFCGESRHESSAWRLGAKWAARQGGTFAVLAAESSRGSTPAHSPAGGACVR